MTDLVKRLRGRPAPGDHCSKLLAEAADVIERLEARNAEHEERYSALEALEQIRRDEIERLKTEIAGWQKAADASTPEDFRLQIKANGEYDD
jgi:hypothetical protein